MQIHHPRLQPGDGVIKSPTGDGSAFGPSLGISGDLRARLGPRRGLPIFILLLLLRRLLLRRPLLLLLPMPDGAFPVRLLVEEVREVVPPVPERPRGGAVSRRGAVMSRQRQHVHECSSNANTAPRFERVATSTHESHPSQSILHTGRQKKCTGKWREERAAPCECFPTVSLACFRGEADDFSAANVTCFHRRCDAPSTTKFERVSTVNLGA